MIAENDRIQAIVEDAGLGLFTGQIEDTEGLSLALELGYVEKYYEREAGFFCGLSKLRRTAEGEAWLRERIAHGH